ncbi:hypothetical protein VTP01DRAFT_4693 [Rhizomucor pusillus]|uniref:uncharacterized protein n=1 Tax=Rhizomucor pusillus TaxID=4840 RepID=UPI0037426AD5
MTVHDLAVFDFDWSLIEADSDQSVVKGLSELQWTKVAALGNMQWTDLIDQSLCELQDQGVTLEQINQVLQSIPLVPSALEVLKLLRANNAHILILSDANTYFIDVILKAHGIRHLVTDIITNPAYFDEKGRLRVQRHIPAEGPQHHCPNLCAVNICKGQELDRYIATHGPYRKVMYVGDGRNDFCPGLRLQATDYYFVRNHKPLASILETDEKAAERITAPVTYWSDHKPILDTLKTHY